MYASKNAVNLGFAFGSNPTTSIDRKILPSDNELTFNMNLESSAGCGLDSLCGSEKDPIIADASGIHTSGVSYF